MKKYMIADLVKDLRSDQIKELISLYPLNDQEAAIIVDNDIKYPLGGTYPDNKLEFWDKVKSYPVDFNFMVHASKGRGPGNLHDNPMQVSAEPILDSIGDYGDDTPMYDVYCTWHGPTDAKEKAYEMNLDEIDAWSNDTSGTYFNENIREAGPYTPYGSR